MKANYSKAVDVYSFGILLWAMWTGNFPYDDLPGSVYSMLKAIEDGRRPARLFNALCGPTAVAGAAGEIDSSSGGARSTDDSEQLLPQRQQQVPDDVWLLATDCWHGNPELRPTMEEISRRLITEKWTRLAGDSAKKQAALDRIAKKEAEQRSLCNLEIKPWEAEQDLNDLFKRIKEKVSPEGLKWSENCKLVEVAFGVKKMLLTAVLPMNLSMDAIIEDMTEDIFPDEIQSMNMTSMSLL